MISPAQLAAALSNLTEGSSVATHIARSGADPLGRFELLFARFREDAPDIEALSEFLASCVVNYVLPLKARKKALQVASLSKGGADHSVFARLSNEAKRKFIEFDKKHPGRASEVGELLAYLVALEWLGAFQVASKMALKTSFNMPVHGLDGIHARFDGDSLVLFFLESKLSASATTGMAEFCDSIKDFALKRKQYLLEYSIVSNLSNLDALAEQERELAMTYFDVYGSNKASRIERSVGVVCYSESCFGKKLPKSDSTTPRMHEDAFSKEFEKKRASYQASLLAAQVKHGIDPEDCKVFLIAVPDRGVLREKFNGQVKS